MDLNNIGAGLSSFTSGISDLYNRGRKKYDEFLENPEIPKEDFSQMPEAERIIATDKQALKNEKIKTVFRKFQKKIDNTDDPLEKQKLEIERDIKIRQLEGGQLSGAEEMYSGKGINRFLSGMKSAGERDIINPNYKKYNPQSASQDEIARAEKYNTEYGNMHNRWGRTASTIGKGLGAFAGGMLGGIPGLAVGTAISKGLPMAADWLMSRKAQKAEDEDAMERRYNPNRL
jgi:hypothetical protein